MHPRTLACLQISTAQNEIKGVLSAKAISFFQSRRKSRQIRPSSSGEQGFHCPASPEDLPDAPLEPSEIQLDALSGIRTLLKTQSNAKNQYLTASIHDFGRMKIIP